VPAPRMCRGGPGPLLATPLPVGSLHQLHAVSYTNLFVFQMCTTSESLTLCNAASRSRKWKKYRTAFGIGFGRKMASKTPSTYSCKVVCGKQHKCA